MWRDSDGSVNHGRRALRAQRTLAGRRPAANPKHPLSSASSKTRSSGQRGGTRVGTRRHIQDYDLNGCFRALIRSLRACAAGFTSGRLTVDAVPPSLQHLRPPENDVHAGLGPPSNFSRPRKRWIVSLRIAVVADTALIPSIPVRVTRRPPGRRRLAAIDRGSDRPEYPCLPRIDARMSAQSHRQYRTCRR